MIRIDANFAGQERLGLLSRRYAVLRRLVGQNIRFGLVGGVATAIHVITFVLLIEGLAMLPVYAGICGFCLAVLASFFGNRYWVFRGDVIETTANSEIRRFVKFISIAISGLGLNSLVVFLIDSVAGLPYGYSILPMIAVVPIFVFTLNKLWAFRR